ncbi:MAG: hypothetical protein Q8O67_18205 [Deltaproteobacteria bacterium]|nr:hypothetical protein [Deltaproteobacteria bacterium]
MHALLLALLLSAPPATSTTTTTADPDRSLCAVTYELRVAVLHGAEAVAPAAGLEEALKSFGCVKVFDLPIGIPMVGDELPEGAVRLADRIGVDWIILVSPEATEGSGYATARLVETSNLTFVKAQTGRPLVVASALMGAVRDDLQKAQTEGVRVNLVLEPSTYGLARGMENALRNVKNVSNVGAARIVDGKSIVVVQFVGPVDALATAIEGLPIGKSKLEVVGVKLRRIELRPILPHTPGR